jgi:release factor glutamine methyltransferase
MMQCLLPRYLISISNDSGIEAAWAGGHNGRQVIDRILPLIDAILSPHGVFYMVLIAENRPKDVARLMQRSSFGGFHMTVLMSRHAFNERLSVVKFVRCATSRTHV